MVVVRAYRFPRCFKKCTQGIDTRAVSSYFPITRTGSMQSMEESREHR
ncbi:hypothetical protein BJY27_000214 [Streptomyces rapamycinicus]|uniref:Uncharacterized protein n=2 Tax=Streptomyces rapamycinicus TaxID=1226757 RepID=A0A3L8R8S0_STRRN|nr:hypothetical protein [Streptomyces rapamycinicus]RLV76084.1 hypothetical protein D3C57_142700 [Streptomyces rapamycinicus NRRL 5491]